MVPLEVVTYEISVSDGTRSQATLEAPHRVLCAALRVQQDGRRREPVPHLDTRYLHHGQLLSGSEKCRLCKSTDFSAKFFGIV